MLRKPTQLLRRTVDQTGRVLVHPEEDAAGKERQITVYVPEHPQIAVALAPYPDVVDESKGEIQGVDNAGACPQDIAETRPYQWPEPELGRDLSFRITSDQYLSAMSVEGIAKVLVQVEYVDD